MSIKGLAFLVLSCASALAQTGNYLGPQILSRGGSSTGDRGGVTTGFQFYAGLNATYETGIAPAAVDSEGRIITLGDLFGVFANIGAYGRHRWRHTTLGLDYTGNFRHYSSHSSYDGSDHMLKLALTNQVSRRLELFTNISAGTFSRYYVNGPATSVDLISSPGYGVFDNRASFLEVGAGASYRATSRLTFSGTGTGFAVRRQSRALVGLNGYSGQGSAAYALTKRRSVDLSYAYSHFDYPRGFGETDLQTTLLGLQQTIGKRWELSLSAGVSRATTIGIEQVAADPITAALFGTAITARTFDRTIYVGSGRGSLRGTFKRSRAELYFTQVPSAGNGVYLTSKQLSGGGTYSYTGIRKASFSVGAGYYRLSSLGQSQLGELTYVSGTVSGSYKLLPALEAVSSFDSRNVQVDQLNGFARLSYRFSVGLNWHPGEIPISLW